MVLVNMDGSRLGLGLVGVNIAPIFSQEGIVKIMDIKDSHPPSW